MKMDLFQPIFIMFGFLHTAAHFTLEISVLTDERMNMDLGYRNERHTVKHDRLLQSIGLILKERVSVVNA